MVSPRGKKVISFSPLLANNEIIEGFPKEAILMKSQISFLLISISLVLAGCGKGESVVSSSSHNDTPASSTSGAGEEAYQISKSDFTSLFDGKSMSNFSAYYEKETTTYGVDEPYSQNKSYAYDGTKTSLADLESGSKTLSWLQEGCVLIYSQDSSGSVSTYLEDDSDYLSADTTYNPMLPKYFYLLDPEIGDYRYEDQESIASFFDGLYDGLVYDAPNHCYQMKEDCLPANLLSFTFSFLDGKPVKVRAVSRGCDEGNGDPSYLDFVESVTYSSIGSTSVEISEAALQATQKATLTFVDGTATIGKASFVSGKSVGSLLSSMESSLTVKAAEDDQGAYRLTGYSGVTSSEKVTGDKNVTVTYEKLANNDLYTFDKDTHVLSLKNGLENLQALSLPDSWEVDGTAYKVESFDIGTSVPRAIRLNASLKSFTNDNIPTNATAFSVAAGNPSFKGVNGSLYSADQSILYTYFDMGAKEVVLPDSLKTILDSAFAGNQTLTKVTLPEGIESIGSSVFSNTPFLHSVNFPSSLKYLGIAAFFRSGLSGEIVLPSGISAIPEECFALCDLLKKVTLPTSLTSIGSMAFYEDSFHEIVLPSSLSSLASQAFYGNQGLRKVIFLGGVSTLEDKLFAFCPLLEEVVYPEGMTTIGPACFQGDPSLTSFSFPSTLTLIQQSAFEEDIRLQSLASFPKSLEKVGAFAFARNPVLTEADFSSCSSLTSLGNSAFYDDTLFASVSLPKSLTSIGEYCFAFSSLKAFSLRSGLVAPMSAFYGCKDIVFTIESGDYSFSDGSLCNSAMSEVLRGYADKNGSFVAPKTLRKVDRYAFENVEALNSVDFSAVEGTNLVLDIYSFQATSLTSVTWPSSTSTEIQIGTGAFSNTKLTSIILPAKTTLVGANAFQGCFSMKAIYFAGTSLPANLGDGYNKINSETTIPSYLYSESEPTTNPGQYWHYVAGVPTVWGA
jgi:hypothetical protein